MGKKEKTIFALAEDFQAVITMVPKLTNFVKVHKEIAAGYQKYRKNGGEAIPGIEKHFGITEQKKVESPAAKETVITAEDKTPKECSVAKKAKKKAK